MPNGFLKAAGSMALLIIVYVGTYDAFNSYLFPLAHDAAAGTDMEWLYDLIAFIYGIFPIVFIGASLLGGVLYYQQREPRSAIEYVQP